MNDEQILERGGTEEDIKKYAEQNGANTPNSLIERKIEDFDNEFSFANFCWNRDTKNGLDFAKEDFNRVRYFLNQALLEAQQEAGREVFKQIEVVMNRQEICNGFQPRGIGTEMEEKEIYFDGFDNGRAMMRIDLLQIIKTKKDATNI